MSDVLFWPPFPSRPPLLDQLFRSVWHFLPALHRLGRIIFPYAGDDFLLLDSPQTLGMARVFLSRDLDPAIAGYAPRYAGKIAFVEDRAADPAQYTQPLAGIVVWYASDRQLTAAARQIARQTGAKLVWADPETVQQETLEVMRFVYSLLEQSELARLLNDCYGFFIDRMKAWKGRSISAFGNGPSLQKVIENKFDPGVTLRAVCNSTIADDAALNHLKPELLFCGDPVQHCGCSLYAGQFREALAKAMADPNRVVATQLGYVPYFRELLPENARGRVIGIGNDRRPKFNVDLSEEFLTAATANIFTMLVLPVAFTFSKQVDIYGCDGMSFAQATKPWSHANETDYMSKMSVTRRVHPGFWRRNYEEEFWSYCQDMEDIVVAGEAAGVTVRNRTPSFVPALAKRYAGKSI